MIHIVDIGSWPEGDPSYKPLLDQGLAKLTEFDPQTGSEFAIGDGKPATLHVCAYKGWTSLLRPNYEIIHQLPFMTNSRILHERPIETRRLDDLGLDPIDLLKIDAQGSELMILESGHESLKSCALVQIELPFVPLYVNQPQYWQIDAELRSQGFVVHNHISYKSYQGQLLEVNALYTRPHPKLHTILRTCYYTIESKEAA